VRTPTVGAEVSACLPAAPHLSEAIGTHFTLIDAPSFTYYPFCKYS
jgi:hypothetical protein